MRMEAPIKRDEQKAKLRVYLHAYGGTREAHHL